jgi:membrane associated rhomboid family serine protease
MFITLGLRAVQVKISFPQYIPSHSQFIQILFAVVVLGLGVTLIKGQEEGAAPSQTVYAAFCGGFGIVAALLGIISILAENLSALIFVALDGLAALFAVAGGIVRTISSILNLLLLGSAKGRC